ncbi:MAG: hydrogenase [Proteobacteria bacterium]|nr:hydrogenase [Pseudomonadota bacterium]
MNIFLLSLAIIIAGGILPLVTYRNMAVAKGLYLGITLLGCITGLAALFSTSANFLGATWSWSWLHSFSLAFACDSLSFFFLIPIFLICPLAVIYSFAYFDKEENSLRTAVSFFCTNVLLVAMALVTVAANILSFALVWEIMSLSSYILVMYDYEKADTRKAGYLYFLFAQAGALLIFAAFGVAFSQTGSLQFTEFAAIPAEVKLIVFFLAFIGFGSKAGVFPLHVWLPHAHPAAPSHISAIMSGVMIKMGIYGILRVYFLLGSGDLFIGQVVLIFGMVSGVLGVLYALGKHNLKKLLAYHSVENIGIILIGAGLGMIGVAKGNVTMAGFGFAGCLLHVFNHSVFKSLLFFGAGAVIKKTGSSHVDELGGLMKRMPITGRTFLIGSVSISGLPPFSGFISEFLVYFSAFNGLKHNHVTLLLIILAIISLTVIGGLASFCFTKVVGIVFLGEPRTDQAAQASEGSRLLTLPMAILAALCLAIGVFPQSFIHLAFAGFTGMLQIGSVDGAMIDTVGTNLALGSRLFLLIFFTVLLFRKLLYRNKVIAKGPTWGCGFTRGTTRMQYTGTSYARSVVSFFRPFAIVRETKVQLVKIFPGKTEFHSRVDDIAEVGLHRGFALPLLDLLGKFRWIQHGNVQLYIGYIILAISILLLASFI